MRLRVFFILRGAAHRLGLHEDEAAPEAVPGNTVVPGYSRGWRAITTSASFIRVRFRGSRAWMSRTIPSASAPSSSLSMRCRPPLFSPLLAFHVDFLEAGSNRTSGSAAPQSRVVAEGACCTGGWLCLCMHFHGHF